jgi:DNA-binding transcriptional MerR regulator
MYRLAVLQRARQVGFTLDEIRQLFFKFASQRWNGIAERKLAELDAKIEQIESMRKLLKKLQTCCECETVERCGAGILRGRNGN